MAVKCGVSFFPEAKQRRRPLEDFARNRFQSPLEPLVKILNQLAHEVLLIRVYILVVVELVVVERVMGLEYLELLLVHARDLFLQLQFDNTGTDRRLSLQLLAITAVPLLHVNPG